MATNPGVMEDYGNAFPVLNSNPTDMSSPPNLWTNLPKIPTVRSSKCTQVFTVPLAERKFRDDLENSFGDEGKQADVCKDIMARTGVTIEMSLSRDQTLTVVVSGREDQVKKARREVMTRLQTQANQTIRIPREHHRFILGAKGLKLQELELVTATKITIPRENENSDVIRIMGTKEGIDKAMHDIQVVSDIQSKLANERLPVQKVYHPFVCGPNNSTIKQLMEETGAKINVPPPSVMKDEIVVTGEKEGVMKCKATIMAIYEEKCRKCQTVSVEVRKSQHKYVIGPRGSNLQEILANTGVSVEVPPLDSSSETITLRGEQDKLGPALTMVYSKANSVVFADISAPDWLHKYIIGKKGSTIRNITANFPKVEGPPEEVDDAVKALQDFLRDLQSRMDFAEIEIDQRFHKHIIGKGGANITKIKNETNVAIKIPSDQENSNTIRIEGEPNGVKQAKQELLEMAARMENEKSRDILIEQRFHRMLIGAKGEGIKATRDKFNQVQITFPDQGKKSDVVTLRGPKTDVDKCFQYLTKMTQDLIREETDTRIDLPNKPSDSDVIVITGVKANVEAAKKRIEDIQKELANIKEVSVEVPHKLHNSIIGAKGRLIRSIMDECGGVIIRFPPEGSTSDKVTIRGPAEDVDKAKTQLQELSKQVFLIGRGGAKIRKVRENTGARIIFPGQDDQDQELITIIGTKEAVKEAKAEIQGLIKDLDNIVEGEVNVDPKYHKHFVARRGEVLRQIGDDFGGVTVSFPRSGVKSDKVVIKGAKDCVEGAKKRILEIVADLVMIECDIPQQFHRTVMGARGSNVQEITSTFDVQIKFPDRPIADKPPAEKPTNAGDAGDAADAGEAPEMVNGEAVNGEVKRNNIITITGKDLVPITKEVIVPFDFHKNIIGQKGRDVRKLMDECNVNISIPPQQQQSDVIKVTGPPANVQRAEEALAAKVSDLELDKEDRLLKSFEIKVEVSPDYHPKLIGRRGEVINKIRSDHDVRIQLPERNDEDQSVIRIIGYERNCEAARDEILRMVKDYEDQVHLEVRVDHRIHSRIIGQKGRGVRRIQDDFKVDLRFPRGNDDKDILVISGAEDDVYECKDHLLNMEEEFLQDIIDDEYLKSLQKPSRIEPERPKRSENPGFYTKNAPWDKDDGSAPDTSSTSEFPSFPGATGGSAVAPKSSFAWGPMRRNSMSDP
ncbi:VIGLN-like protein [Mya arenaria]|uniref:VIGLN-like protein n=1 Tax=Mya arenaria TaxID=6604 RepID=A0ABY7EXS9_MYAAR|nr:VIGLN-like protein [Mya arenaria]